MNSYQKDGSMRRLLAASALSLAIGATPAMARDYPWCAATTTSGGIPQCSFISFAQCQATISGRGGDCSQNPNLAYQGGWRNGGPPNGRQRGDWQNNGWNNGGRW
jgi:hypothetical protein